MCVILQVVIVLCHHKREKSDNRVEHLEKEALERGEQTTDAALIPSTSSVPSDKSNV